MKIDRRQFIVCSSGALAVIPVARLVGAPRTPARAPTQALAAAAVPKFGDVRRNIGTFTMRGGTIGLLVNKDAVLVVDTQYADTATICLDGLKEKSAGRGIDLVVNTHHHADHTGGNGVFPAEAKKLIAPARAPPPHRPRAPAPPRSRPPRRAEAAR